MPFSVNVADTTLDDIQFLKGHALERRMAELAKRIAEEHKLCSVAEGVALEHARNAGRWLREAKKRTGGSGRWGAWVKKVADGLGCQPRTMRQYMRVARHWDAPRIEAARARGETLSISRFIKIIERTPEPAPGTPPEPEYEIEFKTVRKDIREEFAEYVSTLDNFEARILQATLDDVLAVANADLKERVCGNYGGPYYKHREEYHREQEAERGTPQAPRKEKKRRSDYVREAERAAKADIKKAKVAKWNELPVWGNTEPPTNPRRGRRPIPKP